MRLAKYIRIFILAFSFRTVYAQSQSPQPIKIFGKFVSDSDKSVMPGVAVTLYTPDAKAATGKS